MTNLRVHIFWYWSSASNLRLVTKLEHILDHPHVNNVQWVAKRISDFIVSVSFLMSSTSAEDVPAGIYSLRFRFLKRWCCCSDFFCTMITIIQRPSQFLPQHSSGMDLFCLFSILDCMYERKTEENRVKNVTPRLDFLHFHFTLTFYTK